MKLFRQQRVDSFKKNSATVLIVYTTFLSISPLIQFSGLHSRLEYIKSLGFDSIWLSPIFAVGSIALGDDITDFKKYNLKLGTEDEFQAFFEAVAGMGKLDLVLSGFCPKEWLLFFRGKKEVLSI